MPKVNPQRVSIITVSLNSAHTIRDTVESVLRQDYPDVEHIIIDGGSNDGTIEIIGEYKHKISKVISEHDRGIYHAMNKGIRIASGDIIGILNADDYFIDNNVVQRLVSKMNSDSADAIFADLVVVSRMDTEKVIRYYNSGTFSPTRLKFGWAPAHPTFFVKRAIYEKYGLYREDYRIAADFEMFARLIVRAELLYTYLPEPVIRMRDGGESAKGLMTRWITCKEKVHACRAHEIRTCGVLMLLKAPRKLIEYISPRRSSARSETSRHGGGAY